MTDLEKELVEKLPKALRIALDKPYSTFNDYIWNVQQELLPLIHSHTQALVAAAYAACAEHVPVRDCDGELECSCGWANIISELGWQEHIRALTPADAARELGRREWEARKREHSEQEWARLWPPEKDLIACAWGPKCVRCAELNRQIEALQASLSKPAPVERSNENG